MSCFALLLVDHAVALVALCRSMPSFAQLMMSTDQRVMYRRPSISSLSSLPLPFAFPLPRFPPSATCSIGIQRARAAQAEQEAAMAQQVEAVQASSNAARQAHHGQDAMADPTPAPGATAASGASDGQTGEASSSSAAGAGSGSDLDGIAAPPGAGVVDGSADLDMGASAADAGSSTAVPADVGLDLGPTPVADGTDGGGAAVDLDSMMGIGTVSTVTGSGNAATLGPGAADLMADVEAQMMQQQSSGAAAGNAPFDF